MQRGERFTSISRRSHRTDLGSLCQSRRITQGPANTRLLKIGEIRRQVFDGSACCHGFNHHADSNARPTDAGLAAHHFRIHRDSSQLFHDLISTRNDGHRKMEIVFQVHSITYKIRSANSHIYPCHTKTEACRSGQTASLHYGVHRGPTRLRFIGKRVLTVFRR